MIHDTKPPLGALIHAKDFHLEQEYGYFLERVTQLLDEGVAEHSGVKGMKWGVRHKRPDEAARAAYFKAYNRDRSREIKGLGPDRIEAKTKNGETLTLTKDRPNTIIRFIARHKPKYLEDANNFASLTIRDSSGNKVGDAQLSKMNKDEINLIYLGVKESQRGKGYASATMRAAVDFGRQAGVKKLTLEVPGNAPDARHIYEKQGFKVVKEEIDPDDLTWGGLTHMELRFDEAEHSNTGETLMLDDDKPPLDEDLLIHFGVKGMKWGVRSNNHPGASARTNKEARKDAEEFARAKMFYGEGAGTRRKLIKAQVEAKAKRDPAYQAAFDHHLARQDLGQHAERARGERRRKDTRSGVRKTANAVNRTVNGPFAGSAAIALVGAGAAYAHRTGLADKTMSSARQFVSNRRLQQEVADLLRRSAGG